jgi:hypothetical protein
MTPRQRQHRKHLLRLMQAWLRRRAFEHPAAFRQIALLHADDEMPLAETLQPWQLQDLSAMDAGWLQLAGRRHCAGRTSKSVRDENDNDASRADEVSQAHQPPGASPRFDAGAPATEPDASACRLMREIADERRPVGRTSKSVRDQSDAPGWTDLEIRPAEEGTLIRRAYIERARGHSKTFDMAIQIAWILLAARQPVRGMVAAADRDQARLIHEAVQKLARQNPWLCRHLHFVENEVRNTRTGSTLEVLSSHVSSSWGALPDFVICDELCHWSDPQLWQSLISSAAKKPDCLVIILSNAGIGRSWQWDIREHARRQPHWYFSSLPGPQAPWIDDDQLAEQQALLPPAVYARLWLNEWQHSDGQFVSLAEAQACRDESLAPQLKGEHNREYFAAVDYAEKHDLTVGCVVHEEEGRIVVDRMDVVQPTPDRPTPVRWVEEWIESVAARFTNTRFVLDEHQLVGTIQRLEGWHDIRRFDFAGGMGNHRLAVRLRQLILLRQIAWYPDCGRITIPGGRRDDLETELASLILRQTEIGRWRIDHPNDGGHFDDRAFALGAACLHLSEQSWRGRDLFVVTAPHEGGFAWSGFR